MFKTSEMNVMKMLDYNGKPTSFIVLSNQGVDEMLFLILKAIFPHMQVIVQMQYKNNTIRL